MNRLAYIRAISLIGKIAKKIDLQPAGLNSEEQELVRQCLEEYEFYHGHEDVPGRGKAGSEDKRPEVVEAGSQRKPGRPAKGL